MIPYRASDFVGLRSAVSRFTADTRARARLAQRRDVTQQRLAAAIVVVAIAFVIAVIWAWRVTA